MKNGIFLPAFLMLAVAGFLVGSAAFKPDRVSLPLSMDPGKRPADPRREPGVLPVTGPMAAPELTASERQSIGEQIQAAQRWFTPHEGLGERGAGFIAAVNSQGFSVHAGPDGVKVQPWEAGWSWSVETGAAPGPMTVHRDRWSQIRPDGVEEWLVNRKEGLEHGFTVHRPLQNQGGPLSLPLRFGGGVAARLSRDACSLHFTDATSGEYRLSYASLMVNNAAGRRLPARFELAGNAAASIVVETAGAQYPINIDPVITALVSKLTVASSQADDLFGSAVALSGGYLVIGAPYNNDGGSADEGAAYVFTRTFQSEGDALAPWQLIRTLRPPDGAAADLFGWSVAVAGDLIAVGALNGDKSAALTNTGAVYLFGRNTGGVNAWGYFRKLTGTSSLTGGRFGDSVAVTPTRVLVGAPYETVGSALQQGAAYIFGPDDPLDSDPWGQIRRMIAGDGAANDRFGESVALSENHAIIGAPQHSIGGSNAGAAYLFDRTEGTLLLGRWGFLEKINASDRAANDRFGTSVAIHGTTAAVGATGKTLGPSGEQKTNAGAVYLFPNFIQSQRLTAPDYAASDAFGTSVSLDAGKVAIGSPSRDGVGSGSGAVFVFENNAAGTGNYTLATEIHAPDSRTGDLLGGTVAIEGEVMVSGARGFDGPGGANSGAAYVFARSSLGWVPVRANAPAASASITPDGVGTVLAMDGELLAVGCPLERVQGVNAVGSAYLFARGQEGTDRWGLRQRFPSGLQSENLRYGSAVALRGGFLLVGSDSGNPNGVVQLYTPYADGSGNWSSVKTFNAPVAGGTSRFGASVAIGTDWLAIGEPQSLLGGAVHVYGRDQGGPGQWGLTKTLGNPAPAEDAPEDRFGEAVAAEDDVLLVGAPAAEVSNPLIAFRRKEGRAYLFQRHSGGNGNFGLVRQLVAPATLVGSLSEFGSAVAVGSGWAVVGAPGRQGGRVYTHARNEGGAGNWGRVATLQHPFDHEADAGPVRFGARVAWSQNRVLVGAPGDHFGGPGAGGVYLFDRNRGGPDRFGLQAEIHQREPRAGAGFGTGVALDGTVLAAGAPAAGDTGRGQFFVHHEQLTAWRTAGSLPFGPAGSQFGSALAMEGDDLVAGAPDEAVVGISSGAAYVFGRNQAGAEAWGLVRKLTAPGAAANQRFGTAVDVSGGIALIGSVGPGGLIFERNRGGDNQWGHVVTLYRDDNIADTSDRSGESVALAGDLAYVGDTTWARSTGGSSFLPRFGAVHVYGRHAGGPDNWGFYKTLTSPGALVNHHFGTSLAADGEVVVVGAAPISVNPSRVHFFARNQGGANSWGLLNSLEGPANSTFGSRVALSGRMAVIAHRPDTSGDPGRVYLYQRNDADTFVLHYEISSADLTASTPGFGADVAISGTRLVVGDAGAAAASIPGRIHLFQQDQPWPGKWGTVAVFQDPDSLPASRFGHAVAMEGTLAAAGAQSANRISLYRLQRTPYEVWLRLYFGDSVVNNTGAEEATWGPLADPDGDGLSNLIEAYAGFNPLVRTTDVFVQPAVYVPAGGLIRFRWREAKNPHGVIGHPEWSSDLDTWWGSESGPGGEARMMNSSIALEAGDHLIREVEVHHEASERQLFLRVKLQLQGM